MEELLTASGLELARRIRERQVSSAEVVEAHIAHIQRFNPTLNAMVAARFDQARAEARQVDERLAAGLDEPPPAYFGVPCSIKENFQLSGMPQTAGLVARRGTVSSQDAPTVHRLRAAGAIPLGVTNTSELCMWMESTNRVYGRTRNPYDPSRIVGGSSGGEGAVVGAGGAPFGLGADVGGSIRMPAFFNGVFGHKATGGLVPNTGQFPLAHGPSLRMLSTGPLCRRAEDLEPLLRILAGPDGEDSECVPMPLGDPGAVDLGALRVLDVPTNGMVDPEPALRDAQVRAAAALAALGARVEPAAFEELKSSFWIWGSELATRDADSYRSLLGQGVPINRLVHLGRWLVGRSPHTLPSLGLAVLEDLIWLLPGKVEQSLADGAALREQIVEALGDDGVMLFPSYPRVAPRHNLPIVQPFYWVYTAIFNALELPVTQVPLGLDAHGLPLGVQVVARHGNDHLGLAVALALERAFGGWVPPGRWFSA